MHWRSQFLYMDAKFGPSDKRIKKRPISMEIKFYQKKRGIHTFWPRKELRNFGRAEGRTSWRETGKKERKKTSKIADYV